MEPVAKAKQSGQAERADNVDLVQSCFVAPTKSPPMLFVDVSRLEIQGRLSGPLLCTA